jgi:hypothetical protein
MFYEPASAETVETVPTETLFFTTLSARIMSTLEQGCQMVYFQTKNPHLGKVWVGHRLENINIFYANLEYFTDICDA